MSIENDFPRELLQQSASIRLEYFKTYTMAHPLLKEAKEKLKSAILQPASSQLVFVFGPTGVGKTTLRKRIQEALSEELLPILESDPGRIPFVDIEAIGPDSGNWSWKDFYRRLLEASNEPLIKYKVNPDSEHYKNTGAIGIRATTPVTELRYAAEQALHYRKPAAVFIDEAQHLAKMASGRRLQDQLDSIKSLASMTGTIHVLLGTYELLVFRNLSGQLSRRSIDIHFRRYRAESSADANVFKDILWTFQQYLPVGEEPDLVQHWEYLYQRSIGCVGILKDWLTRALNISIKEGANSLKLNHLQATALSVSQCEKMISEIIEGESLIEEKPGAERRLQQLLGFDSSSDATGDHQPESTVPDQKQARKPKLKPGIRKPKRDAVGRQTQNDV